MTFLKIEFWGTFLGAAGVCRRKIREERGKLGPDLSLARDSGPALNRAEEAVHGEAPKP